MDPTYLYVILVIIVTIVGVAIIGLIGCCYYCWKKYGERENRRIAPSDPERGLEHGRRHELPTYNEIVLQSNAVQAKELKHNLVECDGSDKIEEPDGNPGKGLESDHSEVSHVEEPQFTDNDEEHIAEKALHHGGTLLCVNCKVDDEHVFKNHNKHHAEIMMIRNYNNEPQGIKTIHITNSPCHNCARELINYFNACQYKPTIYVGRLWHLHDLHEENRKWLKKMLKEEFHISEWKKLHDMKFKRLQTAEDIRDMYYELGLCQRVA